jgi:RNA polymerase sigma-70 factor (ECF subfamily)
MDAAIAAPRVADEVEVLYRADADRLWRALVAYAGDRDVASEAVAEAYAQAIRRGDAIRDLQAWIWRSAFRIARGALAGRRSHVGVTEPGDGHEDRYADPDLAAALRQLPEAQRAAVVLFYYVDLPVREIAARLGSNSLAVRANLSRGRRRLQALLEETHG